MVSEPFPEKLRDLLAQLRAAVGPCLGDPGHGHLRLRISHWDCGDGDPSTHVALAYELPSGSTDVIGVSYFHQTEAFGFVDAEHGEILTRDAAAVLEWVEARVAAIPAARGEQECC